MHGNDVRVVQQSGRLRLAHKTIAQHIVRCRPDVERHDLQCHPLLAGQILRQEYLTRPTDTQSLDDAEAAHLAAGLPYRGPLRSACFRRARLTVWDGQLLVPRLSTAGTLAQLLQSNLQAPTPRDHSLVAWRNAWRR